MTGRIRRSGTGNVSLLTEGQEGRLRDDMADELPPDMIKRKYGLSEERFRMYREQWAAAERRR